MIVKNKYKMIKLIALLIITSNSIFAYSGYEKDSIVCEKAIKYGSIKDGIYQATVKYTNYATYTNATYTLNVEVKYGNVVSIDFGNGGSVHNGYNNEGYMFSGGYLSFETDRDGNTVAAKASISVSDKNGIRQFKIRIE